MTCCQTLGTPHLLMRRGGATGSAPRLLITLGFKLLVWASLACFCPALVAVPDESSLRLTLARALLSDGPEQQQLLGQLTDSGSKVVAEVLNAWLRDGVYFYTAPDNSKVPVLLEEVEDAKGNARAIRVDNGQFLKDA